MRSHLHRFLSHLWRLRRLFVRVLVHLGRYSRCIEIGLTCIASCRIGGGFVVLSFDVGGNHGRGKGWGALDGRSAWCISFSAKARSRSITNGPDALVKQWPHRTMGQFESSEWIGRGGSCRLPQRPPVWVGSGRRMPELSTAGLRPLLLFGRVAPFLQSGRSRARRRTAGSGGFRAFPICPVCDAPGL